jgi:hypothetical protein
METILVFKVSTTFTAKTFTTNEKNATYYQTSNGISLNLLKYLPEKKRYYW